MIPYFELHFFHIGNLIIQIWGVFVALGIIVATIFFLKLVKEYCLSKEVTTDLIFWLLLGGIIGSRIFFVLFYEPAYFLINPLVALEIWNGGASSVGGLVGAFMGGLLFIKKRGFSFAEILPYFDLASISLWLGWGIGRLGCFLIHDHPGKLSDFFLAVNFPNGARHDLGFYDALLAFVIFIGYYIYRKKLLNIKIGFVFYSSFAIYGLVRFWLDFLRARDLVNADARYFSFTPAQWGILLYFLVLGGFWWWKRKIKVIA
jgi:phosphatidylglycerol:prolipoprotein diacylglycerol transferase